MAGRLRSGEGAKRQGHADYDGGSHGEADDCAKNLFHNTHFLSSAPRHRPSAGTEPRPSIYTILVLNAGITYLNRYTMVRTHHLSEMKRLNEASPIRSDDGEEARIDAELVHGVRNVVTDGDLTNTKLRGNRFHRLAVSEHAQHFDLAHG